MNRKYKDSSEKKWPAHSPLREVQGFVMAGLDPAIHAAGGPISNSPFLFSAAHQFFNRNGGLLVDGRVKPGHDVKTELCAGQRRPNSQRDKRRVISCEIQNYVIWQKLRCAESHWRRNLRHSPFGA